MAYDTTQAAGAKLYISATPTGSATTEILGITVLDPVEIGMRTPIDITTLRDTAEQWDVSGMTKSATLRLEGFASPGDAGQALMKTARAAGTSYNFSYELNDGVTTPTKYQFAGFITKYAVDTQSGKDAVAMFRSELKITGAVTEVAST